jgi:integrase
MASIRKRTWKTAAGEARTGFFVDYYDGTGQRARKQFTTRADANDFRIDIESRIRAGTYRHEGAKVTVSRAAELFLEECKGRMERHEHMTRHTYEVYEGHIWNYICPDPKRFEGKRRPVQLRPFAKGIADITLGKLTARMVAEFRDRLKETGLSVVTVRKILGTLKSLLGHAVELNYIAVNVARGVKVIGRRDEGAKLIEPPSKEALRRLIEVADADFRVVLMFAAATGVRAGELHALRWRHIDFARAEVKIEARVDAYGEEDVTKTKAGMRTVPLSRPVLSALEEWRSDGWRRRRVKRARKNPKVIDLGPPPKAGDLVFPNHRGAHQGHDNMVKRDFLPLFNRLAGKHGQDPAAHPPPPERFNWHALRHFAISCWIEAGLAPKTVQTFAGHSTLAVTMDRYGHLFKSDDHRRAMERIAGELFS